VGASAARLNVNAWQPVQRLKDRFPDLARHFIFEYYPRYGVGPFRHWDQDGQIRTYGERRNWDSFLHDAAIADDQRSRDYHNAADGEYRLKTLTSLLATVE
jgi:hypothetical protein